VSLAGPFSAAFNFDHGAAIEVEQPGHRSAPWIPRQTHPVPISWSRAGDEEFERRPRIAPGAPPADLLAVANERHPREVSS